MKTNSFRNEELIAYVNKILEGLKVVPRAVEVLPYALGATSIQFKGADLNFSAQISDFGMGDIGVEALTVRSDQRSVTFDDHDKHPALSARILPRLSDFVAYQTELHGADAAKSKAESIAALVTADGVQMGEDPQVLKDGKAMTLSQFVVYRPVAVKERESIGISM
jgi:hypothetical protein